MTPHTDQGRGTLIVDRRFRRVGRIKRASGTQDPKLFKMLNGMLDTLASAGRQDVLVAIRDGRVSLMQAWEHYRKGELDRLPTPELMRSLLDFGTWARRSATGEDNRASRIQAAEGLQGMARPDATIGELPQLVRRYRELLEHRHHATFNRHRAAVQAFLHQELGRTHRLYLDVAAVSTLQEKPRKGRPLSVREFRAAVDRMEPAYAEMAWALAVTGMGPKEYWGGRWEELVDRVAIHGTKRAGRERVVPRVQAIARPQHAYRGFRLAWRDAADGRRVYDLRKTFTRWMQEAGIPRTRRRLYLGHREQDTTDSYEHMEVTEFLRADGARLRQLLGVKSRNARTA